MLAASCEVFFLLLYILLHTYTHPQGKKSKGEAKAKRSVFFSAERDQVKLGLRQPMSVLPPPPTACCYLVGSFIADALFYF